MNKLSAEQKKILLECLEFTQNSPMSFEAIPCYDSLEDNEEAILAFFKKIREIKQFLKS